MKKVKSPNPGSSTKSKGVPRNVDEYLAGVPEPARSTLTRIRSVIRSSVPPAATETISYGMPAFKHHGVLVRTYGDYAACSNRCIVPWQAPPEPDGGWQLGSPGRVQPSARPTMTGIDSCLLVRQSQDAVGAPDHASGAGATAGEAAGFWNSIMNQPLSSLRETT